MFRESNVVSLRYILRKISYKSTSNRRKAVPYYMTNQICASTEYKRTWLIDSELDWLIQNLIDWFRTWLIDSELDLRFENHLMEKPNFVRYMIFVLFSIV